MIRAIFLKRLAPKPPTSSASPGARVVNGALTVYFPGASDPVPRLQNVSKTPVESRRLTGTGADDEKPATDWNSNS
jgi:hypothetical protein